MMEKVAAISEVDHFKKKGRELVSLAIAIVASCDERESLPRTPLSAVRRRAIVLLEGAISFVEIFLRLHDHTSEGANTRG